MGWAQKLAVEHSSAACIARPVLTGPARGSAIRCRPVRWSVDAASRDHLSPSVAVPRPEAPPTLVGDPHVNADVVGSRIDLERLYQLTAVDPSTPQIETLRAPAPGQVVPPGRRSSSHGSKNKRVTGSATNKVRQARSSRIAAQPVVTRKQNTVLHVAEQFLRRLEHEVSDEGSRGDGEFAGLRVLTHAEQVRLIGIVQRCSAHCEDYASPDPRAKDVRRVAECLHTSPSIARIILDQAKRARALLIRFSMRLCASIAQKYVRSGGVDFDTLLAEACAGLSEAIARFDRSRDMKFTTYATHWVLRNVRRCLVDEARRSPVQLPPHIHYKLTKLLRIKSDVLASASAADEAVLENNPEALAEAIAQEAGLSVTDVKTTLANGLPTLDLDKPVFDDSSAGENVDYLVHSNEGLSASESAEQALEDEAREQLAAGTLNSMLSTLNSREANVLRLRFGLNSEQRTLPRSEIAAAYGLTGERIRQIEETALRKLSKPWRRKFLEQASKDLW